MRPRLYLPDCRPGPISLSADQSHYLARVLRLQPHDPLVVFNGEGQEAEARVTLASARQAELQVEALRGVDRESPRQTVVIQALCTGDKMDWVVQKATELGAAEIWPVQTQRSLLRLEGLRAEKRHDHWQRIAQAAAAQSGRNRVPQIAPVQSWEQALRAWQDRLQLAEPQSNGPNTNTNTNSNSNSNANTHTQINTHAQPETAWLLDPFATVSVSTAPMAGRLWIAIGPEAGFSDEEEQQARQAGFTGVRCGPRILRTETAAAAVLAAVATRLGEF